jgi:hypothetical protein
MQNEQITRKGLGRETFDEHRAGCGGGEVTNESNRGNAVGPDYGFEYGRCKTVGSATQCGSGTADLLLTSRL